MSTEREELAEVVMAASPGTPTLTALKIADTLADLLAARDRRVRAEAWDEAVGSAYLHETEHWMGIAHEPNPYREESA